MACILFIISSANFNVELLIIDPVVLIFRSHDSLSAIQAVARDRIVSNLSMQIESQRASVGNAILPHNLTSGYFHFIAVCGSFHVR